jgi:uncharacterized damage-inducible protein DinB
LAPDTPTLATAITPEALLDHWQGHRRVTRRIIAAFPEREFFECTIGGMRPFSELALEFLGMAVPSLRGVITGEWNYAKPVTPSTRAEVLELWDKATEEINQLWPTIPPHRFQEVDKAFGQWEMPGYALLLYVIDNEIHHRGQGYVYLRSLAIEPPPFYDRS